MFKTIFSYDFRHSAINQLWRLIAGPILLVLIPFYLSPETQGYWFTFISLAALVIFADMGFSTILLQFSAHEFSHLSFSNNKKLQGNEYHLRRIVTLFRFAIKWSASVAFIAFPIILLVGYFILSQKETNQEWFFPWLIYGLASVIVFINSMVLSFIEGCDRVGEIQKIRFYISFVTVISSIIFLVNDFDLYALAYSLLLGSLTGLIFTVLKYWGLLHQLLVEATVEAFNWNKEVMSLLWRYAVSSSSGYFIFQMFTPIAFHFYGGVEAGKVGLSVAICIALYSTANIWMTVIVPKINMLVSINDYKSLNTIFYFHLKLAIASYILVLCVFILVVYLLDQYFTFSERLVDPISFMMIAIGWFFQVIINALAIYMRAHKTEPLMVLALLTAVYIGITTYLIAVYLPFENYFIGFLTSYVWGLPLVFLIFKKYKLKGTL